MQQVLSCEKIIIIKIFYQKIIDKYFFIDYTLNILNNSRKGAAANYLAVAPLLLLKTLITSNTSNLISEVIYL